MFSQLSRVLIICLMALLGFVGCSRETSEDRAQDYLNRSNTYINQGQYRAAMIEVSNAIANAPEDVSYKVAMAEIYNTLGAGRRAATLLEDVLENAPQEVALSLTEAYLLQGKFLSARETLAHFEPESPDQERIKALYLADATRIEGELEQARDAYLALLQQYPDDLEIQGNLAETYIFMGDSDSAQELINQMLEQEPRNPRTLQLDAFIAYSANNLERAEQSLTSALYELPQADVMLPERAAVLKLLAETLTSLGRSTEALVYQRLLAEGAPESVDAQQRLSDALAAEQQGNYEEAERILQELLDENPESQSAAIMLGVVNLRQGDVESAEPLLSGNVDVETAGADVIRATAMAQAETGKAEQALKTLERALEVRPNQPVLQSLYGVLALSLPEHQEKGYLSLQKALAQDPHRGRLRLALARYYNERGEPEQAMAQLRSAFKFQPADWLVTNVYMNQLFVQEELEEVASAIDELKRAAPRELETALFEAQYLFRRGDQEEGIRKLRDLLQRNSDYARGYGVLAQMLAETDQPVQALEALEQLVALEPANDRALRAGVEIIVSGDLDQTPEDWLQTMARKHSTAALGAAGLQAMMHRERGELDTADRLLEDYAGEESDYIRQTKALIYRDRAQAQVQAGNLDQARSLMMQALALFPNSKSLNLDLVRLEMRAERYGEAKMLLDDMRNRHPDDAQFVVVQAEILAREKSPAEAYRMLGEAWREQPDSQIARVLIELARSQDPQAVPALFEQWERVDPDGRARMLYAAEWLQSEGNDQSAQDLYERLLADNENDAVVLNNLAWLLKDSDLPRAAELAERAVRQQPNAAPILDTYGWLLHLQGRNEEALEYLERAAQLAPGADEIQDNLNTVRNALEEG